MISFIYLFIYYFCGAPQQPKSLQEGAPKCVHARTESEKTIQNGMYTNSRITQGTVLVFTVAVNDGVTVH